MARATMPTAADMMQRRLVTLRPEEEIETAVRKMIKKGLSGAPVVDAEGELCGVLSEHDCIRVMTEAIADGWPSGHVEQQMTRDVDTVDLDDDALQISTRFAEGSHRRLLVLKEGRLVGLISRRDLMKSLAKMEKATQRGHSRSTYEMIDERHRALD